MPGESSETVNAGIKSLYLTPSIKPKPNVCIESMPSEVLLKIFSYLDAVSLLAVGCVNKRFYELANDKPRRFSLIAEYHLAYLTESSAAVGADEFVQLFSLSPGLLVGIWKEKNEIAFVMANLHYNQLLERSILGSATVQYVPPPNKPLLDDIDSEYGLHDYTLHLDLHGRNCMYLCGSFKYLFCKKRDIENGYLRLRVVNLQDNRKHLPIIGTLGICWETDVFKGNIKDCFVMDLTLLDETGKPFWCFSAPVRMELSTESSGLYDYMGHIYTADYSDAEGKVCIEFVWLEETKEYIVVSLVLYVSTKKVNSWYGTNY
ncbi:PREDICTED: F-box only protein 15 isoform X3 [Ficedula albicollis]|uniref:F-box only protein 15 isoform X3 n=1 Tax=Ficedula albicollis TaxID=59894 RepID=UPI0007AD963D|nr:PREDICTED: F-box only protein 15 isoform X3 [Ficedula albicollis]